MKSLGNAMKNLKSEQTVTALVFNCPNNKTYSLIVVPPGRDTDHYRSSGAEVVNE
jgi:hypothetical protein